MNEQIGRVVVGNMLKKSRELNGFAQRDVSVVLGLPNPNYLSMIERGTHPIPLKRLWDFVSAYRISKEEGLAVVKMTNDDAWNIIIKGLEIAGVSRPKVQQLIDQTNDIIINASKEAGVELIEEL